jgi:hypothetical protein
VVERAAGANFLNSDRARPVPCAGANFHNFGPTTPAVVTHGATTLTKTSFSENQEGPEAIPLVYAEASAVVAISETEFTDSGREELGQSEEADQV